MISNNKRALHDFEIIKKYEAGLVLTGIETKSIKENGISLKESRIVFIQHELFLTNFVLSLSKNVSFFETPHTKIKLLLRKKELNQIQKLIEGKGLTIVPLKLYTKNRLIKIEIAVCKGLKKYDKRRILKEKEQKMNSLKLD